MQATKKISDGTKCVVLIKYTDFSFKKFHDFSQVDGHNDLHCIVIWFKCTLKIMPFKDTYICTYICIYFYFYNETLIALYSAEHGTVCCANKTFQYPYTN